MPNRVDELIALLELRAHPEGGFYAETFRSTETVHTADARGARSALTAIWFLLARGTSSAWHRVQSDEAWHWYEGEPLELIVASPDGSEVQRITLSSFALGGVPQFVVPAGWWQAARPLGDYSLVGCTVGPGFDFHDFALLRDLPLVERPALDASLL